jgi:hypothetical protein
LGAEIAAFRTTYVFGAVYNDLNATGAANGISGTLTYPMVRLRDISIYASELSLALYKPS